MAILNGSLARWTNGNLFSAARLQWAPTLTAHDPNPPITLESPADGGVDVGRSTVTAATRAPTIAKALDVGRASVAVTARTPAITKTEDVGRGLVTATVTQGAAAVGAVAFNADADRLEGSDVPSAAGSYTIAGWFKPADASNNSMVLGLEDTNGGRHTVALSSGGLIIEDTFGASSAALSPSNGTWYFFALAVDGSLGGTLRVRAEGAGSWSTVTRSMYTADMPWVSLLVAGNSNFSTGIDGALALLRVWDRELSESELLSEYGSATPASTTDLLGAWALASAATRLTASTGSNLTEPAAGSWVDATGPTFGSGGLGTTKTEDVGRATVSVTARTPEVRPLKVDVGRATVASLARAPTTAKAEDVGRAAAAVTTRSPTAAKAEDVGRATVTAAAYAPTVSGAVPVGRATVAAGTRAPTTAKAEDVGRATASLAARAPAPAKALDAGRATSSALARAPAPAKALSVGRAAASVAAYTPSASRSVDVGRATSSSTARAPTWAKALEAGRVTATVAAYAPTVGYSTITVDVDGRATAGTSTSSPAWAKALDVGRATVTSSARAPSPLSWVAPRMRPGQSWAGVAATGGATATAAAGSSSAQADSTGSTASGGSAGATAER